MTKSLKYYLATYNFVAFIFWTLYLTAFLNSNFTLNANNILLLNIAQGLAVLEIAHALLKWVKSPIGSTVAQVGSRLLVVFLIDIQFSLFSFAKLSLPLSMPAFLSTGIILVSFAWSITEIVRYSFYLLGLFNKQPHWLLWMRYSFFIVLYPLGVTGEWLIFLAPRFSLNFYIAFLLIAYTYYFPVLYKYMWKQRKAKL